MQAILTKDVKSLGQKGQSVKVKSGYFRNFLQPQGFAIYATPKLLKKSEEINQKIAEEQIRLKNEAEALKESFRGKTLVLQEKLTKKGTLYSKVSAKEIVEALEAQFKVKLKAENINLPTPIKATGDHEVEVKLAHGVTIKLKISITGLE